MAYLAAKRRVTFSSGDVDVAAAGGYPVASVFTSDIFKQPARSSKRIACVKGMAAWVVFAPNHAIMHRCHFTRQGLIVAVATIILAI